MKSLTEYRRPLFFTGAGLSVESGIPTYRGAGGIWEEYDYAEYACQRAFDTDPEKVWDFHDVRREAVAACEPNEGHRLIAGLENARIITQNIDGLHQRAGSSNVIELHGSLWRVRHGREVVENFEVPIADRRHSNSRDGLSREGHGGYWRPDIVWFEDMLDPRVMQEAIRALQECDVIVSVGTSGVVYPAADLPRIATRRGIPSIEINPEETAVSAWYTHTLRGSASDSLRILLA